LRATAKSTHASWNPGGLGGDAQREVLGERLVEPQVVPPAHRDEVAEPHVRQLVHDRARPLGALGVGDSRAEDHRVAERDAAGVLHRAGVELGHEGLVVVAERVADAEQLVEGVERLAGDLEQLRRVALERRAQRGGGVHAEPDPVVLGQHRRVGTDDDRPQVGRQPGRGRQLPAAG
jgi:hypothetical protein